MKEGIDYTVTPAGRNIFLDLGYSPEQAAESLAKSQLIGAIDDTITSRRLTQKKAADICHTDQPTLSKVLRGRLDMVTIDRLATWLTLLGRSVEIRVKPYNSRSRGKAGKLVTVC